MTRVSRRTVLRGAIAGGALAAAPQLSILATSREPLGVPGEKAWVLPSLSLPEAEPSEKNKNIFESEAVCLFIERAGDILPGYEPGGIDLPIIAQICLRLDGIPLAIEIAAAQTRALPIEVIAERLDQRRRQHIVRQ